MIIPPRSYYRAKSAQHLFNEYYALEKQYSDTKENKQELLNAIKRIFVVYWKYLKDVIKEKNGIIEFLPRKIISYAIKNNIIDSEEIVWLDYIDILNKLIYGKSSDRYFLSNTIITKFGSRIDKIYSFLYENKKFEKKESGFLHLDYNEPEYKSDAIGISENSYNLLINFFINTTEVKAAWLHGSRAFKTNRKNSDIDILVDSPFESFSELKNQIDKLRIPYRIDISNIHDPYQKEFNYGVSVNAKIIYRYGDFCSAKESF